MIWRVYCGHTDWPVKVEADTEQEAVRLGREKVIAAISQSEFFARHGSNPPQVDAEAAKDG